MVTRVGLAFASVTRGGNVNKIEEQLEWLVRQLASPEVSGPQKELIVDKINFLVGLKDRLSD